MVRIRSVGTEGAALVVHANDDPARRRAVSELLREAGFEVVEGDGGKRAVDLARTLGPDLVLCAVRLRDLDGFAVCRQISASPATAAVPVVLYSAYLVLDEHRARGLDIGADAYLTEPLTPDVLRATLRAVLRARRAESAASEATARERLPFESLPVPAWVFDWESFAFLAVNDAAVKRLGYSRDELLSMSIVDLRRPEDVPVLVEVLRRQKGDTTGVWPLRTKDGQVLDAELVTRLIPFAGRDACLVVATVVTDRTPTPAEAMASLDGRAEAADRRAAVFTEVTRSIASTLDLDTALQRVVDGARQLCGASFAAILLRSGDADVFRPRVRTGDGAAPRRELAVEPGRGAGGQVLATRRPFRTDDYLHDPRIGPEYRWVAERSGIAAMLVVPIVVDARVEGLLYVDHRTRRRFTDDDEAVCLRLADHAAIAVQNARLYEAEQAARAEAEALGALAVELSTSLDLGHVLQRVAEAARDLCAGDVVRVALREPDGAMVYRYVVGTRATGYEQLRLGSGQGFVGRVLETGRPFRTADAIADPHVHPEYGRRLIEAEGIKTAMVIPIEAGGRIEGLLYIARRTPAPFSDDDERVCSRLATQASVAIRNAQLFAREQEARREAQTANRAKDDFLAVLSHELRTPLTTMLGWTRMLRTAQLDPGQHDRALASIERNTQAQARMIDELLDLSRITAGKMRLDRRPLDLAPLVAETVESLRAEATAKELTVETHLDPAAGMAFVDPHRMRQIVMNLLGNAIKFTPPGGRVDVRLAAGDDTVRMRVEDTGVGIERELLPHVFERFRQADWRAAGTQGGLGLGLAIVREIVQLHGGTVEAESDGPGHGAVFTVTLPRMREAS